MHKKYYTMLKHIEVIISYDNILLNELNNHLNNSPLLTVERIIIRNDTELNNFIQENKKITTLIIATNIRGIDTIIPFCQNIINLTNHAYSLVEIAIQRPFKLCNLLTQLNILRLQYVNKLICLINQTIIFDAKYNILRYEGQTFKLTDKETEIIRILLTSPDYKIEKSLLLEKAWGFTQDIDTNTLETHISKLKQKLPIDLILMQANHYSLKIYDLH
jgi:DNA-binding CsgD family transcriptional regulator